VALGILCAFYVVCYQGWSGTENKIQSVTCKAPPEDEQVMLKTCRGP
jgi:hypothetical protein